MINSLLVSVLLTLMLPGSIAQPAPAPMPGGSGEKVLLMTDRDLYVTSEQVFFSVVYQEPDEMVGTNWSQVLYVELVRWNGSRITGTKVNIRGGKASGKLHIPAEVESGNYYLRAYTKWMRNYSPYAYSHLRLKVVNPTTMKTETGPEEESGSGEPIANEKVEIQDNINFSGLSEKYGTRERVALDFEGSTESSASNYLLGVVRKGTKSMTTGSFSFQAPDEDDPAHALQYYPETRGVSLSGKVIEVETGQPVADARVNLSTVAESLYFSTALTDSAGVFLFTFPDIQGDHEFHIATEDNRTGRREVLIDNDFCTRPVELPYHPFFLAEAEKELVRDLALNAQIRSRFESSPVPFDEPGEQATPFYGAPTRTIYEKEYIELKNMEEFFYELVYEVNVRRSNGEASLQMSSFGTLAGYPPLVLMDNIRIDNIDALMKVSCRRVEQIDVVSRGYVIGTQFYSGIISLYSEEHDMAGMKLGEDNNFFTFSLPLPGALTSFDFPKEGLPDYIPDRRNTLTWQPDLPLSSGKPYQASFYTPDVPGTYIVYLAAVNGQDGSMTIATQEIVVQE